jgi:hypothetical protein
MKPEKLNLETTWYLFLFSILGGVAVFAAILFIYVTAPYSLYIVVGLSSLFLLLRYFGVYIIKFLEKKYDA